MAWYTSWKTYLALGLVLPIAGMIYIATQTSNSTVLVLSAIALFLSYPLASMGLYMWATGNGSKWISGINLEKYSEEQRRSVASILGLTIAIGMLILCIGMISFLWNIAVGAVLTVISIIVIILPILWTTMSKKPVEPFSGVSANKVAAIICVAVILIVPCCYIATVNTLTSDNVEVAMSETSISVKALFVDRTINYDDIDELYKIDNFDKGKRISGNSSSTMCSGKWNNSSYGDYELAMDPRVNKVISIKSNDGWLVFNLQTEEKTVALYDELVKKTS